MNEDLTKDYNPNRLSPDDLEYQYMFEGERGRQEAAATEALPRYKDPTMIDYVAAPAWGIEKSLVNGVGKIGLDTAAFTIESAQKATKKFLDNLGLGQIGEEYLNNQNSFLANNSYLAPLLRQTTEELQQSVNQPTPNYNYAQQLLMGAGELGGDIAQFELLGGEKILSEVGLMGEALTGEKLAGSFGRLFEGTGAVGKTIEDKIFNTLRIPVEKLGSNSALRGLSALSRAAGEVTANVGINAVKGASFEMFNHALNNYDSLITGAPMESAQDSASDIVMGGIFGGGLTAASKFLTLGGVKVSSAAIKYVYGKGSRKGAIKIMDRLDMRKMGEAAHGGWISRGYKDLRTWLKGRTNKIRREVAADPVKKENLNVHAAEVAEEIESLSEKRHTKVEELKKYTPEEWEKVPASVFKKFETYMDNQKHLNDEGAHKYQWWDEYKKDTGGIQYPNHAEWARLSKWHKEGQVDLTNEQTLHNEVHEPLATHADELEAIKRAEASKKPIAKKNMEILKKRKKALEEVKKAHELTNDLNDINKLTDDIDHHVLDKKTADSYLQPPSEAPGDMDSAHDTVDAYTNQPHRDTEPTATEEFDRATEREDKETEKKLLSEADITDFNNLPEEIQQEARAEIKEVNRIEHSHKSITGAVTKVLKCVTGVKNA